MNLNEQLQQAYEAGRRQGLNEYILIPQDGIGEIQEFEGPALPGHPFQHEPGTPFPTGPTRYYPKPGGGFMHRIKVPGEWSRWSGYVSWYVRTNNGKFPPQSEWPQDSDWWDRWVDTFGELYPNAGF